MATQVRGRNRGRAGHDRWVGGPDGVPERVARGLVLPETRPGFRLTPEARVFVAGCAFAGQIGLALRQGGLRVTSMVGADDADAIRGLARLDLLGHDNPVSLRQELEWVGSRSFPEEALLALGDRWIDPFLGQRAPAGSLALIRARRSALAAYYGRAFNADLVVLGLGHTETWYDRRTAQALAGPPHPQARAAEPDRFGMKRLAHDEVAAALKAISALILRRRPGTRILVMVSPVPMARTASGEDVILASMAAKSTLHAAATALAARNDGIDYFPAYEALSVSDPTHVWAADRRSLRAGVVAALADAFMRDYGLMLDGESRTLGTA